MTPDFPPDTGKQIRLITYTRQGAKVAEQLLRTLKNENTDCTAYLFDKYTEEGFVPFHDGGEAASEAMHKGAPLVWICAAGIAVRLTAPFIKDKMTDSPVIVIDPAGRFVIPILSGHVGGANALARRLAKTLGATPVLTTASDSEDRFAVDSFAAERGCLIADREKAKEAAVKVLAGRDLLIFTDPESGAGLIPGRRPGWRAVTEAAAADVVISAKTLSTQALQLIPRRLVVGVGCRKGTPEEEIREAISGTLLANGYDARSICALASIDLKAEEPGIVQTAKAFGVPFLTFPSSTLAGVRGSVSSSDFVRQVTGVDNVCERSALTAADHLVIPKTIHGRVTVAAAMSDFQVLLFGGTTEGKNLTEFLEEKKIPTLVCTATPYGAQVLPQDMKYVRVLSGRLDGPQMKKLFTALHSRTVVDATHPYAVEVSANIAEAAKVTGVRLIRVTREETPVITGAAYFDSVRDAAEFLERTVGNILLTTGSKDLPVFAGKIRGKERLYARVLPHSAEAARKAGIPEEHILTGDGPFAMEENVKHIEETHARFLVTKDSGKAGGLPEKVRAAESTGCALLVIRRPKEPEGAVSESRCRKELCELLDT
jgi:cobalt-precorrin 5A hydrolase